MHEIKVTVVEFGDRPHYQMQWRDPMTGRKKTKSTGVERTGRKRERDEALRVAAKHEAELREGRYHQPLKTTWADFRDRYEREQVSGLTASTENKVAAVFNLLERIVNPARLRDVTPDRLSYFQTVLREEGRAETTISSYLGHLQAAMRWAASIGMLPHSPTIKRPRRAKGGEMMKGRPVTGEEFDRMLAKVETGLIRATKWENRPPTKRRTGGAVTRQAERVALAAAEAAPSWRFYLQGLWFSGLRLTESLSLSWNDESQLHVDLSGKYPMLRIPAELEKGHKDRLLPLAPEFAELLLRTPNADRVGRVFKLAVRRGSLRPMEPRHVSKVICNIGAAAGVIVQPAKGTPAPGQVKRSKSYTPPKYASAHDLRRSFGERWASRVMPQVLMQLMRHETIETTLKFYVGRNAQTTAKVLWDAHKPAGNTSGNSGHFEATADESAIDANSNR